MAGLFDRLFSGARASILPPQVVPLRQRVLPSDALVYAIGDVHGCLTELQQLESLIIEDAAGHPGPRFIIGLGDYVDRGPHSATVVDHIMGPAPDGFERICIGGNHETHMLDFLRNPRDADLWLGVGGLETLTSYGVDVPLRLTTPASRQALAAAFAAAMPAEHVEFLSALPQMVILDRHVFVHAGIRPGIPLDAQAPHDLILITNDFLNFEGELDYTVVHGHTPVQAPLQTPNRIAVDTGAYGTGRLSAARVFQGAVDFLTVNRMGAIRRPDVRAADLHPVRGGAVVTAPVQTEAEIIPFAAARAAAPAPRERPVPIDEPPAPEVPASLQAVPAQPVDAPAFEGSAVDDPVPIAEVPHDLPSIGEPLTHATTAAAGHALSVTLRGGDEALNPRSYGAPADAVETPMAEANAADPADDAPRVRPVPAKYRRWRIVAAPVRPQRAADDSAWAAADVAPLSAPEAVDAPQDLFVDPPAPVEAPADPAVPTIERAEAAARDRLQAALARLERVRAEAAASAGARSAALSAKASAVATPQPARPVVEMPGPIADVSTDASGPIVDMEPRFEAPSIAVPPVVMEPVLQAEPPAPPASVRRDGDFFWPDEQAVRGLSAGNAARREPEPPVEDGWRAGAGTSRPPVSEPDPALGADWPLSVSEWANTPSRGRGAPERSRAGHAGQQDPRANGVQADPRAYGAQEGEGAPIEAPRPDRRIADARAGEPRVADPRMGPRTIQRPMGPGRFGPNAEPRVGMRPPLAGAGPMAARTLPPPPKPSRMPLVAAGVIGVMLLASGVVAASYNGVDFGRMVAQIPLPSLDILDESEPTGDAPAVAAVSDTPSGPASTGSPSAFDPGFLSSPPTDPSAETTALSDDEDIVTNGIDPLAAVPDTVVAGADSGSLKPRIEPVDPLSGAVTSVDPNALDPVQAPEPDVAALNPTIDAPQTFALTPDPAGADDGTGEASETAAVDDAPAVPEAFAGEKPWTQRIGLSALRPGERPPVAVTTDGPVLSAPLPVARPRLAAIEEQAPSDGNAITVTPPQVTQPPEPVATTPQRSRPVETVRQPSATSRRPVETVRQAPPEDTFGYIDNGFIPAEPSQVIGRPAAGPRDLRDYIDTAQPSDREVRQIGRQLRPCAIAGPSEPCWLPPPGTDPYADGLWDAE